MFQLEDMWTFCWAFFIVFPIVAFIREAGHVFFAKLFGGEVNITLGRGKTLLQIKGCTIKRVYFLESRCHYKRLKGRNRFMFALIYAGGPIFNLGSALIINFLIYQHILEPHLFFYQFVYFSIYYVFFALLPVDYGPNYPSDGKAVYEALRYGKTNMYKNSSFES